MDIKLGKVVIADLNNNPRRAAILENGMLVEYINDQSEHQVAIGNIYRAKVHSIHKGIQAAFVDIGMPKNAFLYWDDIIAPALSADEIRIEDHIKAGQEITVQVTKLPYLDKGARCTMKITLPGKFCVLSLNDNRISISKLISDNQVRENLKNIATEFVQQQMAQDYGIIMRTEATNADTSAILFELNELVQSAQMIKRKELKGNVPRDLHLDDDFVQMLFREKISSDTNTLVINSKNEYNKIISGDFSDMGFDAKRAHLYFRDYDIFEFYGIDSQIKQMSQRYIYLDNGATIVFDKTEAMTVVDVNTGVFQGSKDTEQTFLQVNIQAAKEIARQIRLRNIGGIIIIDFLNMKEKVNQDLLVETFAKAFEGDKAKNYIGELSKLGLLEMSRQR